MSDTTPTPSVTDAAQRHPTPWREIITAWVVARVAWAAAVVASKAIADSRQLNPFQRAQLDSGLTIWDGDFYLRIAEFGYGYTPRGALRFFPLYPAVGRLASVEIGLPPGVVLPLISNGLAVVATWLLWRVVVDATHDSALALKSIWVFSLFPSASAMVLAYAEPMAMCLGVGALVLLHTRRPRAAVVCAVLAGATRPTAWLLSIVVLVDLLVQKGWLSPTPADERAGIPRRTTSLFESLAVAAGPFLGTAAYLGWVHRTSGDWREPIRIQSELRAGVQDPISRTLEALSSIITDPGNDAINLVFLAAFMVAIVAGWRRLPRSWSVLSIATLLLAMSSQNIDSIGRYGLVSFPFVVGLAAVADRESGRELAVITSCAVGFVAIGVMTLIGGYVP